MDGICITEHFQRRCQQRGLSCIIVYALLRYGVELPAWGSAHSLRFTNAVLREIRSDLGEDIFRQCDRQKNAYIVLSDQNIAVTAAHRYRGRVH